MPLTIDEITYFQTQEVLDEIGVSRQTLWRWRKEEPDFPQGARFRGKLVFSASELEEIRERAFRVEPVEAVVEDGQLALFEGDSRA